GLFASAGEDRLVLEERSQPRSAPVVPRWIGTVFRQQRRGRSLPVLPAVARRSPGVRRVFYRPFSGHVVGERRRRDRSGERHPPLPDQSAPAPAYRWTLGPPISGDAMKVFLRRARRPATRGRPCGGGRAG